MSFYTFLPKLLNMSLTASVVIVFVLLLRLLLKRVPKVISYALWGIVLIRLLCPISIESNISLFGLMDAPVEVRGERTSSIEYVPNNIVHTEYPTVVLPIPGVNDVINDALPKGEEQLSADPLEGPIFLATYAWIAGVLGMAIYAAVSYVRLRRKLFTAIHLRDNIWSADRITSPFVMGLFRPKIYLPNSMEQREQSYIILHEQYHIRRFDHVIKAISFVALCIHWFNPLVWVAFIMAGKDMEMSCDEAVIKKMGEGILADYTASLLSLATGKHIIAGMPLAFGEGDTKGRIRNLANWKKPAFWVVLVAVIACVVLTVCLLTNPSDDELHAPGPFTELIPGTTYVSYQCIYMNPLSSYAAFGGDSGCIYTVGKDFFATADRNSGAQNLIDVQSWEWKPFPYTDKEWAALYIPEINAISNISEVFDEIQYLHLTAGKFLMRVDGDIWIVELKSNSQVGTYLWSIYSLIPEKTMGEAQWEFAPASSSRSPVFEFKFDVDYVEISAVCDNGQLVEFNYGNKQSPTLTVPAGESLHWSPSTDEYVMSSDAVIHFTIHNGDSTPYHGTLYIEATEDTNQGCIYTATLTGTGLHLSQNSESSGGVISLTN